MSKTVWTPDHTAPKEQSGQGLHCLSLYVYSYFPTHRQIIIEMTEHLENFRQSDERDIRF